MIPKLGLAAMLAATFTATRACLGRAALASLAQDSPWMSWTSDYKVALFFAVNGAKVGAGPPESALSAARTKQILMRG